MATQGASSTDYGYNAEGLRAYESSPTKTAYYLYEGSRVTQETDAYGNVTAKNIYGNSLISRSTVDETQFYLYNGRGDVVELSNASSVTIAQYTYDAFGNLLREGNEPDSDTQENEGVDNPYRYKGYRYDEATGLYNLNGRLYDPEIARFTQEDNYYGNANEPLSLNRYTYTYNNPIRYWDPTGHAAEGAPQAGSLIKLTGWDAENMKGEDENTLKHIKEHYAQAEKQYKKYISNGETEKASGQKDIMNSAHKDAVGLRRAVAKRNNTSIIVDVSGKVTSERKIKKSSSGQTTADTKPNVNEATEQKNTSDVEGTTGDVNDDRIISETLAGTDNLIDAPYFVTLNLVKYSLNDYDGLLGGYKVDGIVLEEGVELLPFDNTDNWFGFSFGTDLKQGVVTGGGYIENDEGFALGSAGIGAQATGAQGNLHLRIRFDELNIDANIGGDLAGYGAMVEAGVLNKTADGTYHIISLDGILQYFIGVNVNMDISLKDRD